IIGARDDWCAGRPEHRSERMRHRGTPRRGNLMEPSNSNPPEKDPAAEAAPAQSEQPAAPGPDMVATGPAAEDPVATAPPSSIPAPSEPAGAGVPAAPTEEPPPPAVPTVPAEETGRRR